MEKSRGFPAGVCGQHDTMTTLLWFRRDLRLHDLPPLLDGGRGRRGARVLRARPATERHRRGRAGCNTCTTRCASCATAWTGDCSSRAAGQRERIPAIVKADRRDGASRIGGFHAVRARRATTRCATALGDVPLHATGSPYLVSPGRVTKDDGTPVQGVHPVLRGWRRHGWRAPATSAPKSASWIDPDDVGGGASTFPSPAPNSTTRPANRGPEAVGTFVDSGARRITPTTATGRTRTAPAGCRHT